mgnify:CR=1 FL=1
MDNEKICAVISGGAYAPMEGIEECAFTVACDRGYIHAQRAGVRPDVILGDFDSYSGALPEGTEILRLPVEKDDTDTMSAVRHALDMGYRRIRIYCALGGRLDHLYANIQTGAFAAAHGARAELFGRGTHIYVLPGGAIELPYRRGWSLSVFAVTDEVRGVYVTGAKYPLADAVITNRFPLGTSNEWLSAAPVTVSAETGIYAVMLCRMP